MTAYPDVIAKLTDSIEAPFGLLGQVRRGIFDPARGTEFLKILEEIPTPKGDDIDWVLVSWIWNLPMILEWQNRRVNESSGNLTEYRWFTNKVYQEVQRILTSPTAFRHPDELPPAAWPTGCAFAAGQRFRLSVGDGDQSFLAEPKELEFASAPWFPGRLRDEEARLLLVTNGEFAGDYVAITSRVLTPLDHQMNHFAVASVIVHKILNPTSTFDEREALAIGMSFLYCENGEKPSE